MGLDCNREGLQEFCGLYAVILRHGGRPVAGCEAAEVEGGLSKGGLWASLHEEAACTFGLLPGNSCSALEQRLSVLCACMRAHTCVWRCESGCMGVAACTDPWTVTALAAPVIVRLSCMCVCMYVSPHVW